MFNIIFRKKRFIIILVAIILPLRIDGGVWRYVRKPPFRGDLHDVFFIPGSSIVWIVGSNSVGKSTDAGKTWEAQSINGYGNLWGLWFRNVNDGLACGYDGKAFKTTDAGNTWNEISVPTADDLIRISFWDDSVGVIAGGNITGGFGIILRTTNFGETWQFVHAGDKLCTDVKCVPGSDWAWVSLIAPSGQTNVLRTTNKGLTWQEISIPGAAEYGYSIDATDNGQTVWLAAWFFGNTKVYKTTNGGNTWTSSITSDPVGPWEIKFSDTSQGWMVCGAFDLGGIANVLKTTDGGITWVTCDHPGHEPLYSIAFLDGDTLISVGGCFGGTVIRSTNQGANWYYITQAEAINGFSAVDTEYIWAVGDYATVLRSTNGGGSWEIQRALDPDIYGGTFWCVSFANRNYGYVSGSAYFLEARTRKTTDGGHSWFSPVCNGLPNQALTDIKFVTPDLGWALLIDGRIYKTTDGANNWVLQYQPPSSGDWAGLDFVDTLYGWAAGWSSGVGPTIIGTTDGGANWATQTAPSAGWQDIDFVDRDTGYAVGGTVFIRTTDGGNNWNQTDLSSTGYGVGFGDALHGWVNGTSGPPTIFHTTDGGLTFFQDSIEFTLFDYSDEKLITAIKYVTDTTESDIPFSSNDDGRYLYYPRVVAIDSCHAWCGLGQMNDGRVLKYFSLTGIEETDIRNPASEFLRVSPNPFTNQTEIEFTLMEENDISLCVYDILGRDILTLFKGKMSAGKHNITWNADDVQLPSGIYFSKLETKQGSQIKKLVLLK